MSKTYSELLRDPRWQKRRLEILQQAEFGCACCADNETELHVHHWLYERGKKPWEYEDHHLVALCKDCHKGVEEAKRNIFEELSRCPPDFLFDLERAFKNIFDPDKKGHCFYRWLNWIKYSKKAPGERI